jgi:hypothetical protein
MVEHRAGTGTPVERCDQIVALLESLRGDADTTGVTALDLIYAVRPVWVQNHPPCPLLASVATTCPRSVGSKAGVDWLWQ